jgi:hypothetical protein
MHFCHCAEPFLVCGVLGLLSGGASLGIVNQKKNHAAAFDGLPSRKQIAINNAAVDDAKWCIGVISPPGNESAFVNQ